MAARWRMLALVALLVAFPLAACNGEPPRLLVFSKTAAYRHASIPDATAAVRSLAEADGFVVDATEDARTFTADNLRRYDAVVWLMTSGDVLNASQQTAFEGYIANGGGYVGVHSAADTEYGWAWYGRLVGAFFSDHPVGVRQASIDVEDAGHPSTASVPRRWVRNDEWYNFRSNPRSTAHVLATLDESTYTGGTMGDHPIAWCQPFDGGRSWYTGGGHPRAAYSETAFRQHLQGGIRWAAGSAPGNCS